MNEFIQKHGRLLRLYRVALRVAGSLILILNFAGVSIMAMIVLLTKIGHWQHSQAFDMTDWPWRFSRNILLGLVTLGLSELIKYVVESKYKPSWILRHGDKMLYTYALLIAWNVVLSHMKSPIYDIESLHGTFLDARVVVLLVTVLYAATKVLILVGLAQVLRRILPVIQESKTLV